MKKQLLVYSLFFAVFNTTAAQYRVENTTLYFEGELIISDVRAAIESAPSVRRLVISSPGGDVLAGILFANWVHERKLDIEVKEICASSCANYVLPAGQQKLITDGALLIWHGGAYQTNFFDFVKSFEQALWRKETEQPWPGDARILQAASRYQSAKFLQAMEDAFFERIGVNKELPIAGLSIGGLSIGAWTLSYSAMASYGIENLTLPTNYGTQAYIDHWLAARYPDPTNRKNVTLLM